LKIIQPSPLSRGEHGGIGDNPGRGFGKCVYRMNRSGKTAGWIQYAVMQEKLTLWFYGHKGRCYEEKSD
jgi:hypothetical protein